MLHFLHITTVSFQASIKSQLKNITLEDFFKKSAPTNIIDSLRLVTKKMDELSYQIWDDNPIPPKKNFDLTNPLVLTYSSYKDTRESLKKQLPSITLSCLLPEGNVKGRTTQNIIKYNGLVQYDIDGKDNRNMDHEMVLKKLLENTATVFAYRSPSGNGIKAIIATTNTNIQQHKQAWEAVKKHYEYLGVTPDSGTGGNVVIPLFASDHSGLDWERLNTVTPLNVETKPNPHYNNNNFFSTDEETVQKILVWVRQTGVSIMEDYHEWLNVGLALRDTIPNAREVWKELSSHYSHYNEKEANSMWVRIERKKATGTKVGLGTLVALAKANGYDTKNKSAITITPQKTATTLGVVKADKTETDEEFIAYSGAFFNFEDASKYERLMHFLFTTFDIRYNIISNEIEISKKRKNKFVVMSLDKITHECYKKGFMGIKDMLKPLLACEHIQKYNPFVSYFAELMPYNPDTEPDYIARIGDYVETTNQDFFLNHIRKHLVRTAACAIGKLAFNKHCLTLYGGQNNGKTCFLRWLQPPALSKYIAQPKRIIDKDGMFALCENMFILLDEVDAFSPREVAQIKGIFCEAFVKERPPFGTTKLLFQRRCSFIATTNETSILTDTTGNVRWIVCDVKNITHDMGGMAGYNSIPIDRVWAQAYYLYNTNFQYWLTPKEIAESEINNENYRLVSPEEDLINQYFKPASQIGVGEFWSSTEILLFLRDATNGLLLNPVNIGKILKKNGFIYEKTAYKRGYWVEMNVVFNPTKKKQDNSEIGLSNINQLNILPHNTLPPT
jgi:hypothetical protein